MNEIETKILEINKNEVVARLKELGAELKLDAILDARYFDREGELSSGKRNLRIRTEGDKTVLAYKKRISKDGIKTAEEIEVEISDSDTGAAILESIGFLQIQRVRKRRITYVLNDIHFDIDEYDNIPVFVEVEAPSEEKVIEGAKLLGFSEKDFFDGGMNSLFKHYGKQLGN